MKTREFVSGKLRSVLQGSTVKVSDPPPTRLQCRHLSVVCIDSIHLILADSIIQGERARSLSNPVTRHLVHAGRRNHVCRQILTQHPHIPQPLHRSIFPLYNPTFLDFLIFWEIPSQERHGHVLLPFFNLGAEHAPLTNVLQEVEQTKAKRSMYAETERERQEVILGVKNSEWNAEMNPVVVSVLDGVTVEHDFTSRRV